MPRKKVVKEPVDEIEDLMKKIYVKGYSNIGLYIYYQGNNIDTLKYIKEFQAKLDRIGIGSQVVISTKEAYESVGIHNCFKTEDIPSKWTNFSLTYPVKCLKIKEQPKKSVVELVELVMKNDVYEDDFIEVIWNTQL